MPTIYGIELSPEVGLSRALPPPLNGATHVDLYAPTMLPFGGSCIEATIVTTRSVGDTTTYHLFGWYDWCHNPDSTGGGWQSQILMTTTTFQNKYVRTMSGKSVMTISIETVAGPQNPRCWYLDVYNYSTGTWEQFYTSCGSTLMFATPTDQGWVMWETYNLVDGSTCPSIQSVSALDILFEDASSGFGVTNPITNSGYSSDIDPNEIGNAMFNYALCFHTGTYTFTYPWSSSPTNSWTAATPNP
jgi:hypothetical protein